MPAPGMPGGKRGRGAAHCLDRRSQTPPGGRSERDGAAAREAAFVRLALIRFAVLAAVLLAFAPGAAAAPTRYGELAVAAPATPGFHVLPPRAAPFAFDLLGARWRARQIGRAHV